jgi:hypothetical protein
VFVDRVLEWTTVAEQWGTTLMPGESVRPTRLDEPISRFGKPVFVKIDTEGFEGRGAGWAEPANR